MHWSFCIRGMKEEIVTKKTDFMEDYRRSISKMTRTELIVEWEMVRKRLNPNCKKRIPEDAGNDTEMKFVVEEKGDMVDIHVVVPKCEPVTVSPASTPVCEKCAYCKPTTLQKGRIEYVCINENAKNRYPHSLTGTAVPIAYGRGTDGKIKMRTSPRWCPRRYGD